MDGRMNGACHRTTDVNRNKHVIWKHFTELHDSKSAKCNYCRISVSMKNGGIPNLKNHLRLKHLKAYDTLFLCDDMSKATNENTISPVEIDERSLSRNGIYKLSDAGEPVYDTSVNDLSATTKRSAVWKHYKVFNAYPTRAMCNYCHSSLSFSSGSSSLRKHLRNKHPKIYVVMDKGNLSNGENEEDGTDKESTMGNEIECESGNDNVKDFEFVDLKILKTIIAPSTSRNSEKKISRKEPSGIWLHFSRSSKFHQRVKCNYCHVYIPRVGFNLQWHLRSKHPKIYMKIGNGGQSSRKSEGIEKNDIVADADPKEPISSSPTSINVKKRLSSVCSHFVDNLPYRNKATCNHCKRAVSKKPGSVENLKNHLKWRHPSEYKKIFHDKILVKKIPDDRPGAVLNKGNMFSGDTSKRSAVWMHYSQSPMDINKVRCDYCNNYISYGSGTSNLRKHLLVKHREVYNEVIKYEKRNNTEEEDGKHEEEKVENVTENIAECSSDSSLVEKSSTISEEVKTHDENSSSPVTSSEVEEVSSIVSKPMDESVAADSDPTILIKNTGVENKSKHVNVSNRRSMVWKHFRLSEKFTDKAKCNYCSQILSVRFGSTSSLRNHLFSKHPSKFEKKVGYEDIFGNWQTISDNGICEIKEVCSVETEPKDNNEYSVSDYIVPNNKRKKNVENKTPESHNKKNSNAVFIKFVMSELNVLKDEVVLQETKWNILDLIRSARLREFKNVNSKETRAECHTSTAEANDPCVTTYIISNAEPDVTTLCQDEARSDTWWVAETADEVEIPMSYQ